MAEKMTCTQCGMPCDADEYHPYAACLMFKGCHNSDTVRANLAQPVQALDELQDVLFQIAERLGEVREPDMDDMSWHTQLIARAQFFANDARRMDWLERNAINITLDGRLHRVMQIGTARDSIDAAIHNSARELKK